MAAAITDLFDYASNGTAPLASTLTASKAIGAASLSAAASTGWPTATPIHFKLYQATVVNNVLTVVAGTETLWKGIVSGLNVTNLTLRSGTDQVYPIGAIIEPMPTSAWADDFIGGLLQQHNQNGTHSNVTATSIVNAGNYSQSSGTFSVPDGTIQPNALAAGAITLGYTQVTAGQTTTSTTAVQVTGLSQTVTVPTGGRRVRITATAGAALSNTTAGNINSLSIWDGAVGTGTQLQLGQTLTPTNNANTGQYINLQAIVTPAAGSKTYNVGFHTTGGTAAINPAATFPAFILVEAI